MKPNISITTTQDSNFSSKRHFHWTKKVATEDHEPHPPPPPRTFLNQTEEQQQQKNQTFTKNNTKNKLQAVAVARLRLFLSTLNKKNRSCSSQLGLGSKVIGTMFGFRHGHVQFAFQKNPNSPPALLIELAMPISGLVKEMASGLVRIALECDKKKELEKKFEKRLLEENTWRTYCNGKKCGFGVRKECGDKEWRVLKSVEMISMGAGVLPAATMSDGGGDRGEVMYMRAKFERIIGSRDSEAFYMMNPDSNGAPELSVYLLRI